MFYSMELIEQMFRSPVIGDRASHVIRTGEDVRIEGNWAEFGVASGATIRKLAEIRAPELVFGFDSFEGLPEDWLHNVTSVLQKGTFAQKEIPRLPKNVRLEIGLFEDTLPDWLERHREPFAMIHVDCDLYSSTKSILTLCNHRIVPGTIIRFDDVAHWESYSDRRDSALSEWRDGEYQAVQEWIAQFDRSVEVLHRADRWGASIKVVV